MLHVFCGDHVADTFRHASVPGEIIEWSDPLFEGALLVGVGRDTWQEVRADAIAKSTRGQLSRDQCLGKLRRQDALLAEFERHEETVLWFDACLFDQLILVRHLGYFAHADLRATRLSLICVGSFPHIERFAGLGQLNPSQLAALLPSRHAVTPEEMQLAHDAWAAVRSPDPTVIDDLQRRGTAPLPYLGDALTRFLEQYPSTGNGLNRLENEVLSAVVAGAETLPHVFVDVDAKEERPFFGDTTLWSTIDRMAGGSRPLLRVDGPGPLPLWNPPRDLAPWKVSATDDGRSVLEHRIDFVKVAGIDRWIGGAHLHGPEAQWRWDADERRLVVMAHDEASA